MKVYLVEDSGNSPGRIYAVFRHEEDAVLFADSLNEPCIIEGRTLQEGQPPVRGYNQ